MDHPHFIICCISPFEGKTVLNLFYSIFSTVQVILAGTSLSISAFTYVAASSPSTTLTITVLATALGLTATEYMINNLYARDVAASS
jgi:uncharacterized protein YebE (UPF0316 family)